MKFKKLLTSAAAVAAAIVMPLMASNLVGAKPACFQYSADGNYVTSTTPIFNNICGDPTTINSTDGPVALGDEANFVRIRKNTSGDVTSNKNNPALANQVSSACNAGDKFDVWTYVHNDAMASSNNDGSGTAVAKNVKLTTAAPVDQADSNFTFSSTVSASNAETVSDGATLNCNGKQVKLKLVTQSVHYTNNVAGNPPTYNGLGDGFVNGTNALGNPVFGSGDQWGCFDYRTVIVYQVVVEDVTPPSLGVCKDVDAVITDGKKRTVTVNDITASVTNAEVVENGYSINWGDGSTPSNKKSDSHTYSKDGTYNITASVTIKFADGHTEVKTAEATNTCVKQVSFNNGTPTPPKPPLPPRLPNTGSGFGTIAALFGLTTIAGTFAHRFVQKRRFDA